MGLINPFIPHHPSVVQTFVGRSKELARLNSSLRHTKVGKPVHFMITGERGIGKTSLLNYVQSMGRGYSDAGAEGFSFIVVSVQIERTTTQPEFIRKIELALRRELEKTEIAREFFAKIWTFVQRLEVAGVALRDAPRDVKGQMFLWEDFANSLVETARRTCVVGHPESLSSIRTFDGILILIDEVDTANEQFEIGAFLKYLTEYFQRADCRHIMFGLSGLPSMVDILLRSHRSALRVFEEVPLPMLSKGDVNELIDTYLLGAKVDNGCEFAMAGDARAMVFNLSDGHPHFIQQCCYSAFNSAEHRVLERNEARLSKKITEKVEINLGDVTNGAFAARGAIDVIGDIYYRDLVGSELRDEQVRAVLGLLAQYLDSGLDAKDVAASVGIGTARAADLLTGLVDKGVVRYIEDDKLFRVRHRCFAYWLQNSGRGMSITLS